MPAEFDGVGIIDGATRGSGDAGVSFFRALIAERRARTLDERVAVRRLMKQLCSALLAAHL